MKKYNPFIHLSKFELLLWLSSVTVIILSFSLSSESTLSLIGSLIGVTALIFVSKGYVLGQILTVVFSIFYAIVSYQTRYYGEMITYLCMTTPIAILSVISWLRHPYKKTKEVQVNNVSLCQTLIMLLLSIIVTVIFYYILKYFNTANLYISTISVTTSFIASYLTFLRSPYYAIGYSLNDIVLIILWILASVSEPKYIPMIACFFMFLVNDLYGFLNWHRIYKRQKRLNY